MSTDNLNKIKSTQVLELIRVAHEYCVFTEDLEQKNYDNIISFYQKILPLLYLKGALLPEVNITDESFNERYVTEEHWQNIYISLKNKFKENEYFFTTDINKETQKVSIVESLSDTYQDMKDFVILFQKNQISAKEVAVSEIKRLFYTHWGKKILEVMPILHNMLYIKEIEENNTDI